MHGDQGSDWLDTALVMDLAAKHLEWKKIKQPFEHRALAAASYEGKVYVLGGFNADDEAKLSTDIYDPRRSLVHGPRTAWAIVERFLAGGLCP